MIRIIFFSILFFALLSNLYSQESARECKWIYDPFTPSLLYGKQGPTITVGVEQYTLPSDCAYQKYIWTFSDGKTIVNWDWNNSFSGIGSNSVTHTFAPLPFSFMHEVCLTIECHTSLYSNIVPKCRSEEVCQSFPIYACEFRSLDLGNNVEVCEDDINFVLDAGNNWPLYKWYRLPSNSVLSNNQKYHPTSSGTYVVEVNDPSGSTYCIKRDTIEVSLVDCNSCNININYQFVESGFCEVQFFSNATSFGGTGIIGCHWDFGDGNTSNIKNPTHQYDASGTYAVKLTIIANTLNGQCCIKEYLDYVTVKCDNSNCSILSDFAFEYSEKFKYLWINNSTSNSSTDIVGYSWDFGDGNNSIDENPIHQYNLPGIYNVCLTTYGFNSPDICCEQTKCKYIFAWPLSKTEDLLKDDSRYRLYLGKKDSRLQIEYINLKEWEEIEEQDQRNRIHRTEYYK